MTRWTLPLLTAALAFAGCNLPTLDSESSTALAESSAALSLCIPDESEDFSGTGSGLRVTELEVTEANDELEIRITMGNIDPQGAYNYPLIGLRIDEGPVAFETDSTDETWPFYGIEACGSYDATFTLHRQQSREFARLTAYVSSNLGDDLQDEVEFFIPPAAWIL